MQTKKYQKKKLSLLQTRPHSILLSFHRTLSVNIQERFSRDYQTYNQSNEPTSIGLRIEFWTKSLRFFSEAPVFGHGTGSTRGLFELAKTGPEGMVQAQVISNPHNQTLAFAIQWGVVGVIILYAMWFAHLALFRGEGLMAWIGLLVVAQNMLTSLFNSHLVDFVPGWMYVLGVGVAGGTVLAARAKRLRQDP